MSSFLALLQAEDRRHQVAHDRMALSYIMNMRHAAEMRSERALTQLLLLPRAELADNYLGLLLIAQLLHKARVDELRAEAKKEYLASSRRFADF